MIVFLKDVEEVDIAVYFISFLHVALREIKLVVVLQWNFLDFKSACSI